MTLNEIKKKLNSIEYDFLRTNEHLGNNIILLTLGGSYAYGTNTETSDIDVRGIALNSKKEILLNQNFEQITDNPTDTTIYSLYKAVSLLYNCNPNTIEILGCKPEHYFYISPIGQELLNNKEIFLSKRCIGTFNGYASSMLYRAKQKEAHKMSQEELEKHILKTINHMNTHFKEKYTPFDNDNINLYIDDSNGEYPTEIFIDINLTHYPLRDYCNLWNELNNVVKSYNTLGKRNKHALEHDKMSKHLEHLVRLHLMGIDLLEKKEIITYREKDHDLLMEIRNGKYVTENNEILPEFYEIVNDLEKRFDYAAENTDLPDEPDYKKISEFVMSVNERIIKEKI